ncbi:hypothetical protein GGS21DRAFT_517725 [Xylaria nigripes]|nr:hypothetical protein GGS21DRAFT_517725 [Xylaria nigripes]
MHLIPGGQESAAVNHMQLILLPILPLWLFQYGAGSCGSGDDRCAEQRNFSMRTSVGVIIQACRVSVDWDGA